MRASERDGKAMFFMPRKATGMMLQGYGGGCGMGFRSGLPQPYSSI